MGNFSVINASLDAAVDTGRNAGPEVEAKKRNRALLDRVRKMPQGSVVLVSGTGAKAETPAAPLCPSHLAIDPLVNTPEFREFEREVGYLKDPTPLPMKPGDKLSTIDEHTQDHHEKTAKTINDAIKISIAHFTAKDGTITGTKRDILAYALGNLIITLRETSPENSQNLIFRDADHYLSGRTQEWQRRKLDREVPEKPGYNTSRFSGLAAWVYDNVYKIPAFEEQAKKNKPNSGVDISTCPAAAAGGRDWASEGATDFRVENGTLDQKAAPFLFQWRYKP